MVKQEWDKLSNDCFSLQESISPKYLNLVWSLRGTEFSSTAKQTLAKVSLSHLGNNVSSQLGKFLGNLVCESWFSY